MTTISAPKHNYVRSTTRLYSIISLEMTLEERQVNSSREVHLLEMNSCRNLGRACHIPGESLISLLDGQSKPLTT